jgi:hypothetical protein
MSLKIVVGTNSLIESQYEAYSNHCQFWFSLGRYYPDINFIMVNPARMGIDNMRNMAAKVAIEAEADYLLFLDDDVLVPLKTGLHGLLSCESDIAAGNVLIRGYPFEYMAFTRDLITDSIVKDDYLTLIKDRRQGVTDVDAVGFSFCLIKTWILRKLAPPWFVTGPNFTEDVYFCVKAKKLFPETTIKVNWEVICGHILWHEVISDSVKDSYKKFFEETHPGLERNNYKIKLTNQVIPYEELVAMENLKYKLAPLVAGV